MQPALIHFEKESTPTFNSAMNLVNGNWWSVFISVIGFVVIVALPRIVITLFPFFPESINGIVGGIYSFFIEAPLAIIFVYFLMIFLSRKKETALNN